MTSLADALAALSRGDVPWVSVAPDGRVALAEAPSGLIVPGSFNPLHHGHTELAALAERRFARPAAYEISVLNVDKPELPQEEVIRRAGQFAGRAPVIFTRSPRFAEKSTLFPNCVFAVGADTAARVVDPRYHGPDPATMLAALTAIRDAGCRFFVAGRANVDGVFVALGRLAIPASHADLFEGLGEDEFRVDVSSTALRRS